MHGIRRSTRYDITLKDSCALEHHNNDGIQ
jgi:hypothetical protein